MIICSKCKVEKPESDFYINSMSKSGYNHQCKVCHRAYMKNYYGRRKVLGVTKERTYKRCHGCKEVRPLDAYGKKTQSIDGKNQYCKPCWRAYVYARL